MRAVYFDPVGGASGDMLLAALLDLGAPIERVRSALASLPLPADSYHLACERVEIGGFHASQVTVSVHGEDHPHRTLDDILRILAGSGLGPAVRDRAERVFRRLAAAEARVHAVPESTVHFHEVGAVDAIVDVVGSSVALDLLEVDRVRFGTLAPGTGIIESADGPLPLPAPATLELLTGVPIRLGGPAGEWVTPTAAAVLTALGAPGSPAAAFQVERVGIGAGHRRRGDRPNVLRALYGDLSEASADDGRGGDSLADRGGGAIDREEVVVLETAIDDQAPTALAHAVEELRTAGAIDVFVTAVAMKKGRTGSMITVLARSGEEEELAQRLLRETSTLGLRLRREERRVLRRRIRQVNTAYGMVRVKETWRPSADRRDRAVVGSDGDAGWHPDGMPETDDVARAAAAHGVPFSEVLAAARRAWDSERERHPALDED